jgi:hypothetical protein
MPATAAAVAGFLSKWLLCLPSSQTRVARWFIFKPKIPILVIFGGP